LLFVRNAFILGCVRLNLFIHFYTKSYNPIHTFIDKRFANTARKSYVVVRVNGRAKLRGRV
jgi:hypothetical protein